VLFICVAVVAWWGKALLFIPPQLTWPFSKLLSFPHASSYMEVGAVTVLPWVAMCDRLTSLLARVVFPERVSRCRRAGCCVRVVAHDCSTARGRHCRRAAPRRAAPARRAARLTDARACRRCPLRRLLQALDLRTKPLSTVHEEPELVQ
jgi:hypothetical protein